MDRSAAPETTGRSIVDRARVGLTSELIQRGNLVHAGVAIDQPTIVLVREGVKRLRWTGGDLAATPGQVVVLPAGQRLDINNDPGGNERYYAVSVILHVDAAVVPNGAHGALREPVVLARADAGFVAAIEAARAAILDAGAIADTVAAHRVAELHLWLAQAGVELRHPARQTAVRLVRAIVGADVARPWTAAEIADRLAMSEPTMRRRLAAEATTMRAVLTDLRLSLALAMLQATDQPISTIAAAVGYDSPSAFASSFRRRFGHVPHAVRHGGAPD